MRAEATVRSRAAIYKDQVEDVWVADVDHGTWQESNLYDTWDGALHWALWRLS